MSGEKELYGFVLWDSHEWMDARDLEHGRRRVEEISGLANVG